jgi:DNA-binding transcriptional MerR regulator
MYGTDAVDRLYIVSRLRRIGMSLEQIRRALDDSDWD